MGKRETLSPTQEDYLEAISRLAKTKGAARVRDIARMHEVRKSSVTAALKSLAGKGLVNYEPYELVTLTPRGRKIAKEIIERHEVIRSFFEDVLRVEPDKADANACRVEHAIEQDVLDRMAQFLNFVRHCSHLGVDWAQGFEGSREHEPSEERCRQWLQGCLDRFRVRLSANQGERKKM